jgi:hypothetical protein
MRCQSCLAEGKHRTSPPPLLPISFASLNNAYSITVSYRRMWSTPWVNRRTYAFPSSSQHPSSPPSSGIPTSSSSAASSSTGNSQRSQLLDAAELVVPLPSPRLAEEELPQPLFPVDGGNIGTFAGPITPIRTSFDTLTSLPTSFPRRSPSPRSSRRLSTPDRRISLELPPSPSRSALARAGRRPSLPGKGVSFLDLEHSPPPTEKPPRIRKLSKSRPRTAPSLASRPLLPLPFAPSARPCRPSSRRRRRRLLRLGGLSGRAAPALRRRIQRVEEVG